jgi:hypothetical protein
MLSGGQGDDALDGEVVVDWLLERTDAARSKKRS